MKEFQDAVDAILSSPQNIYVPPDHPLAAPDALAYFRDAAFAFNRPAYGDDEHLLPVINDDPLLTDAFAHEPMSVLALPWLVSAWNIARAGLGGSDFARACEACLRVDWIAMVLARFADMSRQTLVLEYNIARMADPAIEMNDYLAGLRAPDARAALLNEYPVLAARLAQVAVQQANVAQEFVSRLVADAPDLQRLTVKPALPLIPEQFQFSEGDKHNNGRAVIIAAFNDERKVVYKPRDLTIEHAFGALLSEINDALPQIGLRVNQSVTRDGYGWAEFISAQPCKNQSDCTDFYTRIGGLLAVVHLLGGFDLHHENVIAAGADPVLIDLETLFYSFKIGSFLGKDDPYLSAIDYPAVEALISSVISTLMLPQNSRDDNISGLDGSDKIDQVARRYDYDSNNFDYTTVGTKGYLHRPTLDGQPVEPGQYTNECLSGYAQVYRFLQVNGARLAAEGGIIGRMRNAPARLVLRDTKTYVNLIAQSYHPTLLRSSSARWVHFLNIWEQVQDVPTSVPLLPDEMAQLYCDDVPYFWHLPVDKDVFTRDGNQTAYRFDTSGYDCFLARLQGMGEKDLKIQKWIIAGTVETDVHGKVQKPERPNPTPVTQSELADALACVHREILDAALENETMVDWLTVVPTQTERLALNPLGITLYNGVAGMVLYLAWYAKFTGEPRDAILRDKAVANLATQIRTDWDSCEQPGAMDGLGGVAYVFGHLAVLQSDPAHFDEAFRILTRAYELQRSKPELFDITSGAAGLMIVATGLFEAADQLRFLTLARQFAQVLTDAACYDSHGVYWAASEDDHVLSGFSHGLAGISFAFAYLNDRLPDRDYDALILQIVARENLDYVKSQSNWRDWRHINLGAHTDDEIHCEHHWCNGSAGIGLSRLGLLTLGWDDAQIFTDVANAADTTMKKGLRQNHSLCHGDFGNLDFLQQATKVLDAPAMSQDVSCAVGQSCREILAGNVFSGSSQNVPPPELMTGLAGIAWGILRQLYPDEMPDVLLLAPARQRTKS